jgi:carotenoid 1,2-hydratase
MKDAIRNACITAVHTLVDKTLAVEVEMTAPRLSWSGEGYLDSNHGEEPLEKAFRVWDWSRTPLPGGDTVVFYDLTDRHGREHALSLRFRPDGTAEPFTPPPRAALPPILWRVPRATRSEAERPARIVRTLEDTPFYARSVVASRLAGADVVGVHESLDLDRFSQRWVQVLLPFRMPRRGG